VLAAGGASAVLGVLYALMEKDLKRVLAYSTIENIGLVFVGLGLALAFEANGFARQGRWRSPLPCSTSLTTCCSRALCFFAPAPSSSQGREDMERLGA